MEVPADITVHAILSAGVKLVIRAFAELKTLFVVFEFGSLGCNVPFLVDKHVPPEYFRSVHVKLLLLIIEYAVKIPVASTEKVVLK